MMGSDQTFPNRPPSEVIIFPDGRPSDDVVAATYECPDCDSEIVRIDHGDGVEEILIAHDNSCPVLRGVTPYVR